MAGEKEKGDSPIQTAFGTILVAALLIWGLMNVYGYFWGEREGYVKSDDCRTTVSVQENSPETWFKRFTCAYRRTRSGAIMSGSCVSVDTEGSVCNTVYVYQKSPSRACTKPGYPYLGQDDMCHSDPQ